MTDFEQDVIERLTRIETHVEVLKDHEDRLRSVEARQKVTNGALALLAPVLAFLGYHITLH